MDDNLSENDPYRDMKRSDIRPDFLGDKKDKGDGKKSKFSEGLKAAEAAATAVATKGAGGGSAQGASAAQAAEKSPSGLFSGAGKAASDGKKKGGLSFGKITAGSFIVIVVLIIGVAVALIGSPIFMIGALDYNLQKTLGFTGTVAILEKQAEFVTSHFLTKGEVPSNYANDLAAAGISVGQVTASGDFVRTNSFIANIDERKDIAAVGSGFQVEMKDGELAVLFNDEIIMADNFVAAVEADPKMYAAFSEAANISAKFYYSSEVGEIYSEMGLSRHSFNNYQATGNDKTDRENFYKILEGLLDESSEVSVNGAAEGKGFTREMNGEAEEIIGDVADETQSIDAKKSTEKAAQLLNSAISANEPYKAAAAFMAIEEPIQRARIQGDGPVNQMMNVLNESSEVTYTDVNTGEEVTKKISIIDTPNFSAAASEGSFSKEEAANFGRDRVLKSTSSANDEVIKDTAVSSDGRKEANSVLGISLGISADKEVLNKANSNVKIAVTDKNSELFTSIVGGNRAVEGGSFVSNSINMATLGAMPADKDTVIAYSHEMNEALARKAAAERATKSPFDISSPNTFLGSIVHNFASSLVQNNQMLSGVSVVSSVGSLASVTGNSLGGIFGGAIADGEDSSYMTTFGDDCETVGGVGSSADIYCSQSGPITTKYMDKELEVDEEGYKEFVEYGMSRRPTVGVNNAKACEELADKSIIDVIADIFGMYDACNSVSDENKGKVTGAAYVISDSNDNKSTVEKYAGHALREEVEALLGGSESTAVRIRREYLAEHPTDNSAAGILAERSGLSKAEAEVALGYYNYLVRIANYNPTTRFAFGEPLIMFEQTVLEEHSKSIALNYYAVKRGEIEYDSIRSKNFAA
ncbi:hypothetical protein IKF92_02635 [Candidatus Saccharibacteria bacterium]|nr:hypothetical protein [Candidatus Saccharibacteria bacterium]